MESEHHYFASFALGYARGVTRQEALAKLLGMFRSEIKEIAKNEQRAGHAGCYAWSCKVNAPLIAKYEINFYQPVGVDWDAGRHHNFTNVTAKGHTVTCETTMAQHCKMDDDES